VTAAALPRLLHNTTAATEVDLSASEGEPGDATTAATRAITARGEVKDIPGVVASDGKGFTEIDGPITFDAAGRLAALACIEPDDR
jgi:hypothetical protein